MTVLGVIFPPDLPPERLRSVAKAADTAGVEQLWVWEDCFFESGIATAAVALAETDRITVGIGLLPVPLRNVALTAMEIATLERLFPGRFVPGIGHGVLDWMGQVGAKAASPMTLLREYTAALRSLLHGERVTTDGRYVNLSDVALDWPPQPPPPLLVGAFRERTVALAGELSDGVILAGEVTPESARALLPHYSTAREEAGRDGTGQVVAFVSVDGQPSAGDVAARIGEFLDAGTTHVILHSVGDDAPPLERFAEFVAHEVRPLVG
jgi:alkanesulfonate monooxygenase SsuD/methylene tetrahydromethanopterin reductase-like flavin-dependent oxidoreductase (luciferase family)